MRDGPRRFPQNYSCSAVLRCRLASQPSFRVRVCHPLRTHFPEGSATLTVAARRRSYNPGRGFATAPVWADARSLATTCAIIIIFSSSGYLDVSVPRVRPPPHRRCGGIAPAGFPHSDIRGSRGICPSPRLFAACHVLLRLREPQASPMRPYSLSLVLILNGSRSAHPRDGGRGAAAPSRPWSLSLDFSINSISRFDSRTRTAYTRTPGKRTARGRNEPL